MTQAVGTDRRAGLPPRPDRSHTAKSANGRDLVILSRPQRCFLKD